jgi:peptide/nickel transport system permease protein
VSENNDVSGTDDVSEADSRFVPLLDRPLVWLAVGVGLLALEAGALLETAYIVLPGGAGPSFPTLLSRSVIPNSGYHPPGLSWSAVAPPLIADVFGLLCDSPWKGTFLGLSPALSWLVRVTAVYAYAFAWLGWIVYGFQLYRRQYRTPDWTPRDDMVRRFRRHRWGQFGLVVVFLFVVMAVFAPALGPTTLDRTLEEPFSYTETYYDEEAATVTEVSVGTANLESGSRGTASENVGPVNYDEFGRWHPFGTLPSGVDLFTFLVHGARVSLFIGVTAISLGGLFAAAFALLSAYYKGLVDLVLVVTSDAILSLPQLLLLILLSVVLGDTWVAQIYSGAALLALIFAATGWPFLWRAIRGPAFQVSEEEWIDAAKSFGQYPHVTMRKHMAPYILGYLLVYASMNLGGIILTVAGLSYLGIGVSSPTPEWGRAIQVGQEYVSTMSWHISFLPGVMIVLVVTAFNALGDGIRDAIDPQTEDAAEGAEMSAASGGGA